MAASGAEVIQHGDQQAEVALVGFVGWQQLFGDFRQIIQGDARFVV